VTICATGDDNSCDFSRGCRGGSDARDRERVHTRDGFMEHVKPPRGLEREDVHHHGHDYTLRSSETRTPDHSRRVPRAASLASAFSRIVVTPSGATILASLRNTPNALLEVLITAGTSAVKIPVGRGSSADSSCRCQRLQPLERVRVFPPQPDRGGSLLVRLLSSLFPPLERAGVHTPILNANRWRNILSASRFRG
jgi:hypothetical protein